jgi:Succinyl-CoA ligase like flavodoxin domain
MADFVDISDLLHPKHAATPVGATFSTAPSEFDALRTGPVSMMTQSGAIGTTIFSMAQWAGFGFRRLINSGNDALIEPGTNVVSEDRRHAILIDAGPPEAPGRLAADADTLGGNLDRAAERWPDREAVVAKLQKFVKREMMAAELAPPVMAGGRP